MTTSPHTEVLNTALAAAIMERHQSEAYGLVLVGLEQASIEKLLKSLGGPSRVYASVIGLTNSEELVRWARNEGWDDLGFGAGAAHAVRVRNENLSGAIKIAIVQREEDRLHSLTRRGYDTVGPYEVAEQVCRMGGLQAPNDPQRHLWEALASDSLSAYLSLDGILAYFVRIFETEGADPQDSPREALPVLGFLPDPLLLTARYSSVRDITRRLIDNGEMVERLQRADEEDREKAVQAVRTSEGEEKEKLSECYGTFLEIARGNIEVLPRLSLPDAQSLLAGRRRTQPPEIPEPEPEPEGEEDNGGRTDRRQFSNLAVAAVHLSIEGEQSLVGRVVEQAMSILEKDQIDSRRIVEGNVSIQFSPNEQAVSLSRATATEDRFGATLVARDHPFGSMFRDLGRHLDDAGYFDTVRMETLQEYLRRARGLFEGFEGETLLQEYLKRRARLLPFRDLLASSPLACLIARQDAIDAARRAIDAYERLLSHLEDNFDTLRRRSHEGTLFIYNEVLNLDTIRTRGSDDEALLLSPISPLVLWKYVELASLVLSRGEDLPPSDRDLLSEEVTDLPEPLLAVYAPEARTREAVEFGYSSRLGSLPVYRPVTTEVMDLSAKSIRTSAEKLAALYPPVKENLRILLVNPQSTNYASKAVKSLVHTHGFSGATLVVSRMERDSAEDMLPQDRALDELFSEGVITVEEETASSPEQLGLYLEHRPVHLLGIAGERRKNVELIESEGTRLHPLSLPQKLLADPLLGKVSLSPRSVQPADGGQRHPFGLYQKLVSIVMGNPRSEYSLRSSQLVPFEDYRALLPYSQFAIVTGHLSERAGEQDLLRLSQGMEFLGDTVFTEHTGRITSGIDDVLRRLNYQPTSEGLKKLLYRLQEVGGDGLFSTISEKGDRGFSESALRGQMGLAVALNWYRNEAASERHVVLSLDSYLARRWLHKREDNKRTDLLGFRQDNEGNLSIDVIEVKSYEATRTDDVTSSHPGQQLLSVARVLGDMLSHQGDILIDRRREILRLQLFREGLAHKRSQDEEWVNALNDILDGEREVAVRLTLFEVNFGGGEPLDEQVFDLEEEIPFVDGQSVKRLRFGEKDIQLHLEGLVRRDQDRLAYPTPDEPEVAGPNEPDASLDTSSRAEAVGSVPTEPGGAEEVPNERDTNLGTSQAVPVLGFEPSEEERAKIAQTARTIYRVLQDIGVKVTGEVDPDLADIGPSIIRYKVRLQSGERVGALSNRARDLMRELATEREPIIDNLPNTNFVGIDLPRPEARPAYMRSLLESLDGATNEAKRGLECPVGVTPAGDVEWLDLTSLPHMLVAGSTGAGKTMFLYSLIVSLTKLHSQEHLQLLLIDPKQTDFVFFGRLPHLRGGRVVTDPKEAIAALLQLLDEELQVRTKLLSETFSRDIWSYNARHPQSTIPPIVVIIDEFADLADVMDTSTRDSFDLSLRRLAQRARNVGIHLVIATQRPTADIVNGNLKSNLPCRVSFRLASQIDSRTILDQGGAEHLLGNGDMLASWNNDLLRLQGFYLPDQDIIDILGLQVL